MSRRQVVAWLLGVAAFVCALLLVKPAPSRREMRGVWLGMSPGAIPAAFHGGRGSWEQDPACSEPTWNWRSQDGAVVSARFEAHQGQVSAVRMRLRHDEPEARGPRRELGMSWVLGREPNADGTTSLVWLSVDCDEHGAEAAELLAGAPLRR